MKFRDFEALANTLGSTINNNLNEVHSCLKMCFGLNLESDALVKIAWREWSGFFQMPHTMAEIDAVCRKSIVPHFYDYFKIVVR